MREPTQDEIHCVLEALQETALLREELNNLKSGKTVILPRDEEHARFMLSIAQGYLNHRHAETFKALTKEY